MSITKILYEPYFIIICLSLVITLISYFIMKTHKKHESNKNKPINIPKMLLYTFIISVLVLLLLKFIISYLNKNNYLQKGGTFSNVDKLTIVSDDVHFGLIDD